MKNDKVKKWIYLILIFGGFFILRNFVPSGLDQMGWDGFLVLFVAVLLWLTEAVPMAVLEVKDILEPGSLDPRHVLIPKFSVDYIVKAQGENNIALAYHPEMTGDLRAMADSVKPLPFSYKKVIARRAAMELKKGDLVNLGIGIPASVANVANEEGLSRDVTLSLGTGVYGGVPLDGPLFGAAVNPDSISRSADAFTVYDGGGLNMTVLGCAEIDMAGNVNVSKFSGRCHTAPGLPSMRNMFFL